ncbi:MAG: hypothetical protein WAN36_13485, partial [Calditrichia bacterium]
MKTILLFIIIFIFCGMALAESQPYLRVAVSQLEDLYPLISEGVEFYDVKIYNQQVARPGKREVQW